MIHFKKYFAFILASFILCCQIGVPVFAANEANFMVNPILPQNQRPDTSGYFDLIVEPSQTQQLSVEIINKDDAEITVEVEAFTASTNLNGVINYTTPGMNHKTLAYEFTDLILLDETVVTVPANGSKIVSATINAPAEEFEGYLLGSIHIKKQLADEQLNSGEMILNQYSYVVAVKLAQSEQNVDNEFVLEEVQAELTNGRASIVNYIVNPQAVMVKGMDTTVRIFQEGSDTLVLERSMTASDMAPNSVFPFTIEDEARNSIKAGNYRSLVDIEYNGQVWSLEKDFTILPEEAAQINNNAVNLGNNQTTAASGLPTWAIVAIVIGIALFVAIIILLVYLIKKRG